MEFFEELNEMIGFLECLDNVPKDYYTILECEDNKKIVVHNDKTEVFYNVFKKVSAQNKKIKDRFSVESIYKFLFKKIKEYKIENKKFDKKSGESFFYELENKKPRNYFIVSPITGIDLSSENKVKISCFEIGKRSIESHLLDCGYNYEYYISVEVKNIYDERIAIEEAYTMFLDFTYLLSFLCIKQDEKHFIKIGMPIVVDSTPKNYSEHFFLIDSVENNKIPKLLINSDNRKIIPIDKCKDDEKTVRLFELYKNKKNTDIENRIISAAIYIGKSNLGLDTKTSILYSCIGLEALFAFDEKSLFQPGTMYRVANLLAYTVYSEKKTRKEVKNDIKIFYRLRSSLVHGADKEINADYRLINIHVENAIWQLLYCNRFDKIKTISDLYDQMEDARDSYTIE